jgi:hypothetical protein
MEGESWKGQVQNLIDKEFATLFMQLKYHDKCN